MLSLTVKDEKAKKQILLRHKALQQVKQQAETSTANNKRNAKKKAQQEYDNDEKETRVTVARELNKLVWEDFSHCTMVDLPIHLKGMYLLSSFGYRLSLKIGKKSVRHSHAVHLQQAAPMYDLMLLQQDTSSSLMTLTGEGNYEALMQLSLRYFGADLLEFIEQSMKQQHELKPSSSRKRKAAKPTRSPAMLYFFMNPFQYYIWLGQFIAYFIIQDGKEKAMKHKTADTEPDNETKSKNHAPMLWENIVKVRS
jgi:hypothetical protein